MLPALSAIARELGAARANDAQFVITSLFLGLGIGQNADSQAAWVRRHRRAA